MAIVEVEFALTPADHKHYLNYVFRRQIPLYVQVGLPLLLLLPALYTLAQGGNPLTTPIAAMGIGLAVVLLLVRREALRLPGRQTPAKGQRTLRCDADGVHQRVGDGDWDHTSWAGISEVTRDKLYIYLFETQQTAYVIPLRAFATAAAADEFFRACRQLWQER